MSQPTVAELQAQYDFELQPLVDRALQQMEYSYSPYSQYAVGCALLTTDGTVIGGSNIENASYGLANCAERSAIFAAASRGYRSFKCVVVATRDGGSCCGACRQVLREFLPPEDKIPIIVMRSSDKTVYTVTHIDEMLPGSFGPQNLGKTVPLDIEPKL